MIINVIGSGYMGKQITSLLSIIGFDVLIWQKKDGDLELNLNKEIRKLERVLNAKSKGSFKIVNDLSKLENHITIETVVEDLNIKKEIFNSLKFKENLFSNTSSIKLSDIKKNINGFHFMNPISIKIIELCKVGDYNEKELNILLEELKNISFEIINVTDSPGYIINKIIFKDISFFFYLLEVKKYSYENLSKIYNHKLNQTDPVKLVNIIGVDTCFQILKNLNKYDEQYYVPNILNESIKNNVLGNKNNQKFKIL